MTNLMVVCRNKRLANELFNRTVGYLKRHTRDIHVSYKFYSVTDRGDDITIRFVTLEEMDRHIDIGFCGIRMGDDVYEHWLDQVEGVNKDKEVKNDD